MCDFASASDVIESVDDDVTVSDVAFNKPCPDRRDYFSLRGILFNINRTADLLLPERRLIIAVHHFQLHIDVGVKGRAAPVRGPDLNAVPGSLGGEQS